MLNGWYSRDTKIESRNNRILECAEDVKADFIVTGDKHLLSLKKFQNTSIITLSDFLLKFCN